MKAEQLLILASVRGIDLGLSRPKRDIPLKHKSPPRRRKESDDDPGIPGILTAQGRQTRTSREAEWSTRDLAMAVHGMPDVSWRSLCWVVGLEEPSRMFLKNELFQIAVDKKEREAWPKEMKRGNCGDCGCLRSTHYVEDLCTLAVSEMAKPLESEIARARFFGLAEHNWRRYAQRLYQGIYLQAHAWYLDGIKHIQRRLNERENSSEAA